MRERLPIGMVEVLSERVAKELRARALPSWGWRGRSVKLVDGTGILMPDTPQNQARHPQLLSQAEGMGSPQARLVGEICLSTGAIIYAAMGAFVGKGTSELGPLRRLQSAFCAGNVMLADALYCNYFLIAAIQAAGVGDCLIFCVMSHTLSDGARSGYGEERYTADTDLNRAGVAPVIERLKPSPGRATRGSRKPRAQRKPR